jgi:hypothetical protein
VRRKFAILSVAVVLAAGGLYFGTRPACACLTIDQAAHVFLRTELHRVLDIQQLRRSETGAYASSLAELGYAPDTNVAIRIVHGPDSLLQLQGESVTWPGVHCGLLLTPTTQITSLRCEGKARRRS